MAFEFHVSRAARERYDFHDALFESSGNVILPNFPASRRFAGQMNERRDPDRYRDRIVHAAELNAMGLIDEILHHAVEIYRRTVNPKVMAEALSAVVAEVRSGSLDIALSHFVDQFPPLAVHLGRIDPAGYLAGSTDGIPNREVALEEMLMLWLANANPAFAAFDELFDDAELLERTPYEQVIGS
ncbi:MAG: alpha-amylase family glycosyl hydrolase, partial [Candidatus Limnocylindrales bacterium]